MVVCGAEVEVVKRITDGFEVLPRRWEANANFLLAGTLSTIEQGLWCDTFLRNQQQLENGKQGTLFLDTKSKARTLTTDI